MNTIIMDLLLIATHGLPQGVMGMLQAYTMDLTRILFLYTAFSFSIFYFPLTQRIYLKPGALLAIPSDTALNVTTIPGKKIMQALTTYGNQILINDDKY